MLFGILAISWSLTLGYVPLQEEYVAYKSESLPAGKIATVAELGLRARLDRVTVYGAIENYQFVGANENAGYFLPYRADYKFGVSIKIAEGVELVAEHECDHPVVFNPGYLASSSYLMAETRIAIRFSGGNY